ncbi:MAG: hypothetical protein OEM64_13205 [Gammaproteobacteria bacterium]|nr:hypothetical protein [Gammaproteobacteria bacterium]MDH3417260.1 hypothetical protein [Gammaproteobacteria bacterium]
MPKKQANGDDRARLMLAQEAARIMVEHGVRDFRVAKQKAAERLGMSSRGSLPRNAEVELAVSEHLQLFGGGSHANHLDEMRQTALAVMELFEAFTPRLVGPVLSGTADENSAVNLHVFSDSPEAVAMHLAELGISYGPYERRLKTHRGRGATANTFPGYRFGHEGATVEATVFPIDGIRQAPISPIDGKPMKRADRKSVKHLTEAVSGMFVEGSKADRREP